MKRSTEHFREGLFEGICGIITNDISLEKQIRYFSRNAEIDADLVLSLLGLRSFSLVRVTQSINEICKIANVSAKSGFFFEFIAMIRGDIHILSKIL